jgi:hypothetical protein
MEGRIMPVTRVIWITRQRVTVRHVRGLLDGLDQLEALAMAEVDIRTVSEADAYVLEPGPWRFPGGGVAESGYVFTSDNLPVQGVLLVAADEMDD